MEKRIVIIGAGPTGLGAAYRLKELRYKHWVIFEKEPYIGGLAASVKDDKGFIWDKGGHVLFSHYRYFDNMVEKILCNDYVEHQRRAYIYAFNRWVPYPFQNNVRYLPRQAIWECISGLIEARKQRKSCRNFEEWIFNTFGAGIAKYFMVPQNLKTWRYPLAHMSKDWIADRISVVDIKRILENIIYDRDDISWGPNNKFKFPLYGGTGGLFNKFMPIIKGNLSLRRKIIKIDIKKKQIFFEDGSKQDYDILVNTSPLDQFVKMISPLDKGLLAVASLLKHCSSFIVGVGIKGKCDSSKCWMYFPESSVPSFRITYFSNYSRHNVPDHKLHWSLLCETNYSEYKKVNRAKIVQDTINGLVASKLISSSDRKRIVSAYLLDIDYAYPIPTLKRDMALKAINSYLERKNIFSRGRFGSWRYEIGNMDHSFMQGVEIIERYVLNKPEVTYNGK
jgi:protoporphyrinogen oxidase